MTSLSLLQLVSPTLPVGAFSYSEGFEVLVHVGIIKDESDVQDWLEAELKCGALRIEAALLSQFRIYIKDWIEYSDSFARDRLIDLDGWLLATREASEMRAQHRQMGSSLLKLLIEMDHSLPEPIQLSWPAAWSWAATSLNVSEYEMVEGYLYSWVANQLSASVRLIPLGSTSAQVVQQNLLPLISAQAQYLCKTEAIDLWSGAVGASLAQLSHSELYSRLFRS